MSKPKQLVIKRETLWRGIGAAAKRLGVSHCHLNQHLNGKRPIKSMPARLKAANIVIVK